MYRADGPEEFKVVGETEFVQGIAAVSASGRHGEMRAAAGIVGTADLRLGDRVAAGARGADRGEPAAFSRHPSSRGVGRSHRGSQPAGRSAGTRAARSGFRQGYAYLRQYGLTFEGWVYHTHIADLTDLARAFPDTHDHLQPSRRADRRRHVRRTSRRGVRRVETGRRRRSRSAPTWSRRSAASRWSSTATAGTSASGRRRPTNCWKPMANWYRYTIEQFGPRRCMFESNFPVDRLSCSYTVLWNQFKKLTKGFSADERTAMFHDTAMRVYRLPKCVNVSSGRRGCYALLERRLAAAAPRRPACMLPGRRAVPARGRVSCLDCGEDGPSRIAFEDRGRDPPQSRKTSGASMDCYLACARSD